MAVYNEGHYLPKLLEQPRDPINCVSTIIYLFIYLCNYVFDYNLWKLPENKSYLVIDNVFLVWLTLKGKLAFVYGNILIVDEYGWSDFIWLK